MKKAFIPAMSKSQFMEIDGCMYEVYFGDAFSSVHYKWWVSPPVGWEPLAQAVDILTESAGIYL